MNKKDRMIWLIEQMNKATEAYEKGEPYLTDSQWDEWYYELKNIEKELGYTLPNSPTQTVQYEVVSELKKVEHNHPMLSLDKTKDWGKFINYFSNLDHSKDVIGMIKLDGLTCSLRYINGELVSAETRGNGKIGEDILHNARVIKSIPKKISYKEELILDGEVICTYQDFEQFSLEYKNPRNFVSGSIRLLDSKECAKRNLTFIVWNIVKGFDNEKYFMDKLSEVEELGFKIVPWTSSFDFDADEYLKEKAKKLGYPIDGLVGRFNDIEYGESLGSTDHHSRAAFAFKFYDETYETEVKNIEWTMGRTGQLTPVLVYSDIEINGTICNRASLHNISIMKKLMGEVYPGQRVFIYKANQIIPQVAFVQTNNPKNITPFSIPKVCPYCGEPTEIRKDIDSEILYCTNLSCNGRLINRLDHFCGKKGLDIKGLSKKTLEKLIDWKWLNSLSDIFELQKHREEWINQTGFGIVSVDKILSTIEESKKCETAKFIAAAGIPLIGKVASEALAKKYHTYDQFRQAVSFPSEDSGLYDIPGIGEVMINNLINFNYTEIDLIFDKYIVEIIKENHTDDDFSLKDKIFVITGKMKTFKNRDALKKVIEEHGGKVTGSVTSKTSYLINNDTESTSSKNLTAKKLGVTIISEQDLLDMITKK